MPQLVCPMPWPHGTKTCVCIACGGRREGVGRGVYAFKGVGGTTNTGTRKKERMRKWRVVFGACALLCFVGLGALGGEAGGPFCSAPFQTETSISRGKPVPQAKSHPSPLVSLGP